MPKKQVYISHVSEDWDFAQRLANDLRSKGYNVWLAREDIGSGISWRTLNANAIKESTHFIFVISPEALDDNRESIGEFRIALDIRPYKPMIIPLKVREVEIGQIDAYLKQFHIYDCLSNYPLDNIISDLGLPEHITRPPRIHIVTSAKGGVGKTLLSLATAANYHFGVERGLLAIDMNSMNSDLARILFSFVENEPLPFAGSWQRKLISNNLHVIRPNAPYLVKGGASYLWDSLRSVLLSDDYSNGERDILVDTNLNIANLSGGRTDLIPEILEHSQLPSDLKYSPEQLIKKIYEHRQHDIYIWIFWTWASFFESQYIQDAISWFESRFRDSAPIKFVHVLNPSALMPPQITMPSTLEGILQLRDRAKSSREEILRDGLLKNDPDMERLELKRYEDMIKGYGEYIRMLPRFTPFAVPGLSSLAQDTTTSLISYSKFESIILNLVNPIKKMPFEEQPSVPEFFVSLSKSIRQSGSRHGRPSNVFPISTHNPSLTGYTEMFARSSPDSIDDLQDKLDVVMKDIEKFIQWLDNENPNGG